MNEIVNLRRAKKLRVRAEQAQAAKENRIRHGRNATQKANDSRAAERREAALDGKRGT